MPDTTAALVFDYAPGKPNRVRRLARRALPVLGVLGGAALGALIGWTLAPAVWTAEALYQMRPPPMNLVKPEEVLAQYERDMRGHVGLIMTPESLEAVAAGVASLGYRVPPLGDDAWLRRGLSVRFIPDSELVAVRFSSGDPMLARAVARAVVTVAETRPPPNVSFKSFAQSGRLEVHRNQTFAVAGGLAGAAAASLAVLWLPRRQRETDRP